LLIEPSKILSNHKNVVKNFQQFIKLDVKYTMNSEDDGKKIFIKSNKYEKILKYLLT
jgi:hypothetical protein